MSESTGRALNSIYWGGLAAVDMDMGMGMGMGMRLSAVCADMAMSQGRQGVSRAVVVVVVSAWTSRAAP